MLSIVNFVCAICQRVFGLKLFGGNGSLPKGESNRGPGVYVSSHKLPRAELRLHLIHGDHLEVVTPGLIAKLAHVVFGGVGVQVCVIYQTSQIIKRVLIHVPTFPSRGPEALVPLLLGRYVMKYV